MVALVGMGDKRGELRRVWLTGDVDLERVRYAVEEIEVVVVAVGFALNEGSRLNEFAPHSEWELP